MQEAEVKHRPIKNRVMRLAVVIIALVVASALIRNILRMRSASDRLTKARDTLAQVETENEGFKEKLEEVKSGEYTEREARDKLGLVYDGEYVVVLPDEDVLRSLSPRKLREEETLLPDPNWKKWLKLFM